MKNPSPIAIIAIFSGHEIHPIHAQSNDLGGSDLYQVPARCDQVPVDLDHPGSFGRRLRIFRPDREKMSISIGI